MGDERKEEEEEGRGESRDLEEVIVIPEGLLGAATRNADRFPLNTNTVPSQQQSPLFPLKLILAILYLGEPFFILSSVVFIFYLSIT